MTENTHSCGKDIMEDAKWLNCITVCCVYINEQDKIGSGEKYKEAS